MHYLTFHILHNLTYTRMYGIILPRPFGESDETSVYRLNQEDLRRRHTSFSAPASGVQDERRRAGRDRLHRRPDQRERTGLQSVWSPQSLTALTHRHSGRPFVSTTGRLLFLRITTTSSNLQYSIRLDYHKMYDPYIKKYGIAHP
jgi:hypothetical protein